MNTLISEAIRSKKRIQFYFKNGLHTVEPYCYGVLWTGEEAVRAYNLSAYSRGWHLFKMDDIHDVILVDSSFEGSRPGYEPYDKAMYFIYCRNEEKNAPVIM